jgi:hypothetical protein
MGIQPPKIDERSYEEIRDEALARIPVHNPEWTNFNPSDPGVTLIHLFAFMTDSLLYRTNQIPERNRYKFLQLLGIPLQPPTAARGIVTFINPRGPLRTETLAPGMEVLSGQVPFRTQDGVDVLPIEAQVYTKSPLPEDRVAEVEAIYEQLYESFKQPGVKLEYYETQPLELPVSGAAFPVVDLAADTVDGSLWVALLARRREDVCAARREIANKVLSLGILPAFRDANRVLQPEGLASTVIETQLVYEIPKVPQDGELPSEPELRVATYDQLDPVPTGNLLFEPGIVKLNLPECKMLRTWEGCDPLEQGVGDFPPTLEDTETQDRAITWIRIRLRKVIPESAVPSQQLSARISWVGINAARVTQRAHVYSENLGRGTGEPDQVVSLTNTPVIRESVKLTVDGELWQRVEDLMTADAEVSVPSPRLPPNAPAPRARLDKAKVFTVDRESGEILFGDGLHGARPRLGALIQASYDYGGGPEGLVGIGAINKGPTLPAGIKVANPVPTWGADAAETVEQAEKRIPAYLQHRDRLVTLADFERITKATPGVELGRVEVKPLLHPLLSDSPAMGVVTLLVIPKSDPLQPDAPVPDRLFLDAICRHINPRRLITTEVHVVGPEYVPIWVSVGIEAIPGVELAPVREKVKQAIRDFLSPLKGGFDGQGWPLEKAVEALEIWTVATRVDGIAQVNGVNLGNSVAEGEDRIPLTGVQLPRLLGLSVQTGDAQSIDELRGGLGEPPEEPTKSLPVPTPQPVC